MSDYTETETYVLYGGFCQAHSGYDVTYSSEIESVVTRQTNAISVRFFGRVQISDGNGEGYIHDIFGHARLTHVHVNPKYYLSFRKTYDEGTVSNPPHPQTSIEHQLYYDKETQSYVGTFYFVNRNAEVIEGPARLFLIPVPVNEAIFLSDLRVFASKIAPSNTETERREETMTVTDSAVTDNIEDDEDLPF